MAKKKITLHSTGGAVPPYRTIQGHWNSQHLRLFAHHQCAAMTEARRRHLRARWQEPLFRQRWREMFDRCEESDFLAEDWKNFSFNWVIKNDENYVKILEGQYANEEKPAQEPGSEFC